MLDKQNLKKVLDSLHLEAKKGADKAETERVLELYRVYEGEDHLVSSRDLAELMKNRPAETKYLSGFTGLDRILDGFRENQLIVLAAPTKSGKTSFCVELTTRLSSVNPTWIPFEESAEELIQKFLDRKEEPPLFYTPKTITGNTTTWIEKKVIEAKAKYDSKVMFVDHLHFVVNLTGNANMSLEIGKTMRELKGIAKRWNIILVLIAHLRKTRMDEQPGLEDLRDSSFVAQEADTVLMLWRETKRNRGELEITNNVNLSVQANRRTGRTGNVKLVFEDGRFFERAWETDPSEYIMSDDDFNQF
jgi:replicative DNA helicase